MGTYTNGNSSAEGYMALLACVAIIDIALGILLLVKRTTQLAYAVGILGILWAIIAIATGGTIGAGIIATVLAIIGARKIDKIWKDYVALQ